MQTPNHRDAARPQTTGASQSQERKSWNRPVLVVHGDARSLTEHQRRRTGSKVGRGPFGGGGPAAS